MEAGRAPLVEEIAYEQWHRMLFARFLAENSLLIHPEYSTPITLEECRELAPEEGEPNAWALAARYAASMLPGIFRPEDPSAQVRYAREDLARLEAILTGLALEIFTADDSLGWVYQFWQSKAKDEINRSGRKIGANELPAVTQLFTEDYMVRFLLQNSLGAWWASRHSNSPLIKEWEYLRLLDDGTPAAGTFPDWPDHAAEVTMMDPCCGSGHFLVAAFDMLSKMRKEEEGLSDQAAGDAVLSNNVHGLEIDLRCTQIAVFTLAFAAWKTGGYRILPLHNLACCGSPVKGQLEEWTKLAGDDMHLNITLGRLYALFREAPTLGSLIDPAQSEEPLFAPDFTSLGTALRRALLLEQSSQDSRTEMLSLTAGDTAKAAAMLGRTYTLVATNVPYLLRRKQSPYLQAFAEAYCQDGRNDLATVFLKRCADFCEAGGTMSVVSPQNWLSQTSYKEYRVRLLSHFTWNILAILGTGSFRTISGEVVRATLLVATNHSPIQDTTIHVKDISEVRQFEAKVEALRGGDLSKTSQLGQLHNPDSRVASIPLESVEALDRISISLQGTTTGDLPLYVRCFWELTDSDSLWKRLQSSVSHSQPYGGREHILQWRKDGEPLRTNPQARLQGMAAWGRNGVVISQMSSLAATLYSGDIFDMNVAALVPKQTSWLPAIWAFCSSPEFKIAVRRIDQKVNVTNATLVKVPFDLERWQKVADEAGPLPEPYSDDPTQWLFKGDPTDSTEPLQVTVARLLGYRWPDQDAGPLDILSDEDGIVCLSSVLGEPPAVDRLQSFLAAAYGDDWTVDRQDALLAAAEFGGKSLAAWLRDGFFAQHCGLFHNRPFIWHIWDGVKDGGFSALVNYHKLTYETLGRLIYSYLGAWIDTQTAQDRAGIAGANARLVAALELKRKLVAIHEGEDPYDIYVRWKPLHEQPIGWNPDLNDGVRLNIRPFVLAGVLRSKFTVNWNKDRGRNPDGSERLNDIHLSLAEKRAAREAAGV
jgi:hypothetical protein